MIQYIFQGYLLGLAYVAPIGMQNLYVIHTAIRKSRLRAYQVALITSFFDISLGICCFFGMGILMEQSKILKGIILLLGSIAVMYIGFSLMKHTPKEDNEEDKDLDENVQSHESKEQDQKEEFNDTVAKKINVDQSLVKVALTCFTVTWINPQALIDGSLLLGGFKATLPPDLANFFILGVALASLSWFLTIATIISTFKKVFNQKILYIINMICGAVILFYGAKLLYNFVQMVI